MHKTPGRVWSPACNQIALVRFQAIDQQTVEGRAEALQHQTTQRWIYSAVA